MELSDFQALSFDCYGTLIDWEAGIAAVLMPWACAHGLSIDEDELLAAYAVCEAQIEATNPTLRYPEILRRCAVTLADNLGIDSSIEVADRLAGSVPDWPAFNDSTAALAALSKRYQLIVLSNVDRRSFAGSALRLATSFDSVLTAEDVGFYKPSAHNFDALHREVGRLGIDRGHLLHVAQSLFHDHVPAKVSGLPTVWINRRRGRAGWGATPPPSADVVPDWEFPSMAAFARAAVG